MNNEKLKPGDPGYWKMRSRTGQEYLTKPKAIPHARALWELACLYFERVDSAPIKKKDFIRGGDKAGTQIDVDAARPYTWSGFEDFLFEEGIVMTLDNYKHNRKGTHNGYEEVVAQIGKVMYANKFEGASVGIFNPVIIARELGLVDKTQSENKNIDISFDYSALSAGALEEIAAIRFQDSDKPLQIDKPIEEDELF
jgi:hypothetical protein